ncbi:MAG: peptidylprolyl isomerase [Myxococcaceae bacterium]|nr:peptidylprolyl isomerase [Myxococcaceae bacterium]MCI0669695.1 peptidylprolyl isomerase [Myxococcaceae bacterium]
MRLSLVVVVAGLWFAGCATLSTPSTQLPPAQEEQTLAEVAELEAERSLAEGRVESLATKSPSPKVRARAFRALARMQPPGVDASLLEGLRDAVPEVRAEAAFAVGQRGLAWDAPSELERARLTVALLDAETAEVDGEVRLVQLESLGKLATPAAAERLAERLGVDAPALRTRAALSLGVVARRGTPLPAGVVAVLGRMETKGKSDEERYAVAYALAQSKAKEARPFLLGCTKDASAEVRSMCVKGLAEVGTAEEVPHLSRLLADADERVAVEAVRALLRRAAACGPKEACPALEALGGLTAQSEALARGDVASGAQPLLALAQAPVPPPGRALLARLRGPLAQGLRNPEARDADALARIDCRLAAAQDRSTGALTEVRTCGGGRMPEPERLALGLRELGAGGDAPDARRAELAASYLGHPDVRVRTAALEVLAAHPVPALAGQVRPLLASDDVLLASGAAGVVAKMHDTASSPAVLALLSRAHDTPDVAQAVAEALATLDVKEAVPGLRALLDDPQAAVRTAAASALTALTGERVLPPFRTRPGAKVPGERARSLTLRTVHGDVVLALDVDDAPLTAGNLAALARRGYFDGLTFHRVVPDFVVQGGDPRGTGEGGPGYTLPCEMTRRPYRADTLGMALSGKDTGGSQFFITHSPQPHLDGRYTAFGEVVQGQDVVRRLLEGDRILEVRVQE